MWDSGNVINISGNPVLEYIYKKNDLRVLLCPIQGLNSCNYMRVIHSGSKDEVGVTKSGAAHFLEHMSFRINDGKIWELAAQGDQINASTNLDSTKFFVTHLPEQTEDVLKIDAHRFLNHTVPIDKISVEMQAVKNELLQKQGAGSQMFAAAAAMAFQSHPYHGQTIGELSDVENSKAFELNNYREHFYVPNNATLIFTGNFHPQTVLKHVHKYFGNMPKGEHCNPVHCPEPSQMGVRTSELNIAASCNMVCLAFHSPSGRTKESLVLKVIADLLWKNDRGRAARLINDGILHDIGVYCPQQKDPYLFFLHGTMGQPNPFAPQKMLEILQTFVTIPVNDDDLHIVKQRINAEWNRSTESASDIMNVLAAGVSIGKWTDANDRHEILSSITKHDITRVSSKYFRKDNLSIVSVVPKSDAESQSLPEPEPRLIHSLAPKIDSLRVDENSKNKWSMSNIGRTTNVLLSPHAKCARATISARFEPKYHDIASLFVHLRQDANGENQLSELHSNRNFALDHEFVHLNMELPLNLNKLNQAANLITKCDWFNPDFHEEKIEIKKRKMILELRTLSHNQDYITKSTFVKGIFTNTPYHLPMSERIGALTSLSAKHLRQFHREWLIEGNNNYNTIVSPTSELGQQISNILPLSFERPVATLTWKSLPRQSTHKKIEMSGCGSISFMIGQTVPVQKVSDTIALKCAAEIFGGGMTGRLMHIVREQKGLGTYGIYSEMQQINSRMDAVFVINGSFSPDSYEIGMQCTKDLLDDFCKHGITQEELKFAKSRMIGSKKISRDNIADLTQDCIDEIISGNDPETIFRTFDANVMALTVSQVNCALRKYLDCNKMYTVSCG